jgi:hypothetical protein
MLTESQRQEAEAEILVVLDQQLHDKMEAHKLQWRRLIESGEISDEDDGDAMVVDQGAEQEGYIEAESEAWVTDSEAEQEGNDEEVVEDEKNVYDVTAITKEFMEIKEVAGKAW